MVLPAIFFFIQLNKYTFKPQSSVSENSYMLVFET